MRVLLLLIPFLIACGPSLSHETCPPNLLTNAGFEDGDGGYDGKQKGLGKAWETICGGAHPEIYALDSTVFHSGKFSQRMTCENYNVRFASDGEFCFDTLTGQEARHPIGVRLGFQAIAQTTPDGAIKPGMKYSCGVWVKIKGLSEKWEWFRLSIYWLDSSHRFIGELREDADTHKNDYGTHDWKKIEITSTAPANTAYAKVYLHHHFEHGTIWYDDAWLRECE